MRPVYRMRFTRHTKHATIVGYGMLARWGSVLYSCVRVARRGGVTLRVRVRWRVDGV